MTAVDALAVVGGKAVIGTDITNSRELIEAIRRGIPVAAVEHLLKTERMTLAEIDDVILPRKTLEHRRKIGTLTAEQSDRLFRAARVIADAEETFGSKDKAATWLRRPTTALGGDKPIALLDTTEGAHQVELLLVRIAHGIAA
jgi:putative toxin-antitoxin system antitoxin component (TIGR02293 family)